MYADADLVIDDAADLVIDEAADVAQQAYRNSVVTLKEYLSPESDWNNNTSDESYDHLLINPVTTINDGFTAEIKTYIRMMVAAYVNGLVAEGELDSSLLPGINTDLHDRLEASESDTIDEHAQYNIRYCERMAHWWFREKFPWVFLPSTENQHQQFDVDNHDNIDNIDNNSSSSNSDSDSKRNFTRLQIGLGECVAEYMRCAPGPWRETVLLHYLTVVFMPSLIAIIIREQQQQQQQLQKHSKPLLLSSPLEATSPSAAPTDGSAATEGELRSLSASASSVLSDPGVDLAPTDDQSVMSSGTASVSVNTGVRRHRAAVSGSGAAISGSASHTRKAAVMIQKLKGEVAMLQDKLQQYDEADIDLLRSRLRGATADVSNLRQHNNELKSRVQLLEDKLVAALSTTTAATVAASSTSSSNIITNNHSRSSTGNINSSSSSSGRRLITTTTTTRRSNGKDIIDNSSSAAAVTGSHQNTATDDGNDNDDDKKPTSPAVNNNQQPQQQHPPSNSSSTSKGVRFSSKTTVQTIQPHQQPSLRRPVNNNRSSSSWRRSFDSGDISEQLTKLIDPLGVGVDSQRKDAVMTMIHSIITEEKETDRKTIRELAEEVKRLSAVVAKNKMVSEGEEQENEDDVQGEGDLKNTRTSTASTASREKKSSGIATSHQSIGDAPYTSSTATATATVRTTTAAINFSFTHLIVSFFVGALLMLLSNSSSSISSLLSLSSKIVSNGTNAAVKLIDIVRKWWLSKE